MDAVFFVCSPEAAQGVASIDDVDEPAGEPLSIDSPGALQGLVRALGAEPRGALRQLRDATCQSFPVWRFASELSSTLRGLEDPAVDDAAERWRTATEDGLRDADLYELSLCIGALRDALLAGTEGSRLFVLLEEKA